MACIINDSMHGKIGFYRLVVLELYNNNYVMQNLSLKFRQIFITSEKSGYFSGKFWRALTVAELNIFAQLSCLAVPTKGCSGFFYFV